MKPASNLNENTKDRNLVILILIAAAILRSLHIVWKYNVSWEPDCFEHILIAERASIDMFSNWQDLISVWAKPLYSFFFAGILWLTKSQTPLPLVQMSNAMLFLTSVYLVWLSFRNCFGSKYRNYDWIIPLIGGLDYICFRSSVSALTEPIGALVIATSLYFWTKRSYWLSAIFCGMAVLCRIDALLLCFIQGLTWIYCTKRFKLSELPMITCYALALLAPGLIWNFAGYIANGDILYLLRSGYPLADGVYGYRSVTHYLYILWVHSTWIYLGLAAFVAIRKAVGRTDLDYSLLQAFCYVAAISILNHLGKFGLAGMPRYLVLIMPYLLLICGGSLAIAICKVNFLQHKRMQAFTFIASILCLCLLLKKIVSSPKMQFNQWTALGTEDYYLDFSALREKISANEPIYTDRAELYYYARSDRKQTRKPLLGSNSKNGITFFVEGWTESTSGKSLQDYKHCKSLMKVKNIEAFDCKQQ